MGRNLENFIRQNFQKAIDYHEIQAFYQPVIRTSSRQLCSFEALARWIDPEIGMIYPDEFIPVLERDGLIHLLDAAILRQVCARLRSSINSVEIPIPVSVNLSRLDFTLCDIFTVADHIISDFQIPHDFIYFEVTESVMAEQKELLTGIVDRFRGAGYQVWMDDFGSAYSSLNVLKEFSFDELKLDMSFLRPFNLRSRRIVTAVVKMAKVIDIHTLAEGVETEEQFAYLRDIGCEKVQGYYFGKPLPFDEAIANLQKKEIRIELPRDRQFYDEIGKIDYLSAVPFMKREEYQAVSTARQLNSIPLALAVFCADCFRVLFYNSAFEEMVHSSGVFTDVYTQELLGQPQPYHKLTRKIINLMDAVKVNGDGRMLFTISEQYYEIRARRMTRMEDKYCVLITIANLTKESQSENTGVLDDSVRGIYSLFERITLINYPQDTIRPLYTSFQEDLLSSRQGIRQLLGELAEKYIYPDDRERFLRLFDPKAAKERLASASGTSFSDLFRSSVRHGQYAWKEYTVLKLDEDHYFMLVRNLHDSISEFLQRSETSARDDGLYSPQQLWNNLMNSELLRIFWKDNDRRFLGASKAFLDYYGFSCAGEIIGKNDEELGWHVHPDLYKSDEYKVIHEGLTFHNMPGHCMKDGENRDILASKAPLYDANGQIKGLIGYFIDRELLDVNDKRGRETSQRDLLTGLFNSRGIAEEANAFRDEYKLRGTDFVRLHIEINDFGAINRQHGFDFGDRVLRRFAKELKLGFGRMSVIGRCSGHSFVLLQQIKNREETRELRARVKAIGSSVHSIRETPITLYLSVGYALYSESLDLEEQAKSAELRLHADHDQTISSESRLGHASELFSLFDDLPVPYSVYHVAHAEHSGRYDAVFFYVNHKYEEFARLPAKELLGHTVREVFPFLGEDWYQDVKSAALDGKIVEGNFENPVIGKTYRFTARQIIYPGYCAITCVEAPSPGKTRKHLLIVDDIESNREILGELLKDDYDICYACDGMEALEMLRRHRDDIALMILDLIMPKMSGREVLSRMQADDALRSVPVIVLTVDHEAELECLKLGAMDFIPKPYPDIEIVKARIARCIELCSNRDRARQS